MASFIHGTPMTASLLALAFQAGTTFPVAATAVDRVFAYGAVALMVALVWWHHSASDRRND